MGKKQNTTPAVVADTELEAAVAQIEATDAQSTPEPAQTAAPAATETKSFTEMCDDISDARRKKAAMAIGIAFDARGAFETAKNANNDSIHRSLNKARARISLPSAAAVMIAAGVDPEFINRVYAEGARYNVYAADKLADLIAALRDGKIGNAINNAVVRSMIAFKKAGLAFTGDMAKAAASDKIRVSGAEGKALVRHTVSAGTAPTQSSSTMTALQTLGIVTNKGSAKYPVYELTDEPQTQRLLEICA